MHIAHHPQLCELTTIRLGGKAIALIDIVDDADALALPEVLERLGGCPFVLGRGSNVLADDGTLPITLLRMQHAAPPVQACPQADGSVLVQASAGLALPRMLAWCARQGFAGLEHLAGIPGCLGGALFMNAGSYGSSIGDVLQSVRVFSPATGLITLTRTEFEPQYRHTVFPFINTWFIALELTLRLHPAKSKHLFAVMGEHLRHKSATQPVRAWSAGCAFKNPSEASAGKLLDSVGFRGKSLGGMRFSSMHANFLLNEGHGTTTAALDLLAQAHEAVKNAYGISLELEVRRLSC